MHSPETRIYMAKTAVIYGSDNLFTLERTKVKVPVLDLISYRYKVSAFRIGIQIILPDPDPNFILKSVSEPCVVWQAGVYIYFTGRGGGGLEKK